MQYTVMYIVSFYTFSLWEFEQILEDIYISFTSCTKAIETV